MTSFFLEKFKIKNASPKTFLRMLRKKFNKHIRVQSSDQQKRTINKKNYKNDKFSQSLNR